VTRSTHTYVVLDLSPVAYDEIRRKLEDAGYGQAFHSENGAERIDMTGLAVSRDSVTPEDLARTEYPSKIAPEDDRNSALGSGPRPSK
jgi:hypothetical protein